MSKNRKFFSIFWFESVAEALSSPQIAEKFNFIANQKINYLDFTKINSKIRSLFKFSRKSAPTL
jgi:hypothetical protein